MPSLDYAAIGNCAVAATNLYQLSPYFLFYFSFP